MSETRTAPTGDPPLTSTRLHGLDALRAGALLLGIVLHSILPFLPGVPWLVVDSHETPAATVVAYVIHLFRMPLFMLLAGYFARMSWHRRGTRSFLADRVRRIGLPIVVFWPFVMGSLVLLVVVASLANAAPTQAPEGQEGSLFSPTHLWFLWVLLECYLIMLAARFVAYRLLGAERAASLAARAGLLLTSPVGVLLAAVPYALSVTLQSGPRAPLNLGITEPQTFVPEPSGLVGYFGAFAVGWALHACPDALARLGRHTWIHLAVGVVATWAGFVMTDPDRGLPPLATVPVLAVAAYCLIYALLGIALRHLAAERPAVRYLADASYWMYIIHLPLLVALQIPLAGLDWPIAVKLLLTWTVAGAVMMFSYHFMVRSTWIGKWLNGRKHPRLWPPSRHRPVTVSMR